MILCARMNRPKQFKKEEVELVAREIVDYLDDHPHAQDTARGIREWWLFPKYNQDLVEEALKKLINEDLIVRDELSDPPTYKKPPQLEK